MAETPGGVRHDRWIGGTPAAPASGRYLGTSDPAIRLPGDEIAAGTGADVTAAVDAAAAAQPAWAARSAADRSAILHAVAGILRADGGRTVAADRVRRRPRRARRSPGRRCSIDGGALTIETPFGGFKQSGYGREKGIEALHEYAQTKTISLSLA